MNTLREKLSLVPWQAKRTANGDGKHIPEAIENLVSPEESVRRAAYWKLDNYIVLQSDLFEAAYSVIPFLIELLQTTKYGRELIYDLLFEIANGYAPANITCVTADGSIAPLKEACFNSVKSGISLYTHDLNDSDSSIRGKAHDLIELLSEPRGET